MSEVCGVEILWSDGILATCNQPKLEGGCECYAHAKYFEKVLINEGKEEVWQSTPAYMDRERPQDRANTQRFITQVYSPDRDVTRPIFDEFTD